MQKILLGGDHLDRQRIQEYVSSIESRLRRRLRGKLSALGRGAYDIDDVLSSARRRLDLAYVAGRLHAHSESEVEAYLSGILRRIVLEVHRSGQRQARIARLLPRACDSQNDVNAIDSLMRLLQPDDQAILNLWARGLSHAAIAATLRISIPAYRSRWRRLWACVKSASSRLT